MPKLTEHDHNTLRCLCCKVEMTTSVNPLGSANKPETGAYSICVRCGEVSIFEVAPDGSVSLREPNFVEMERFNQQASHVARAAAETRAAFGFGKDQSP